MAGRSRYRPPSRPPRRRARNRRRIIAACAILVGAAGLLAGVLATVLPASSNVLYAKDLPAPRSLPRLAGRHLAGYTVGPPTTAGRRGAPGAPGGPSGATNQASQLATRQASAYVAKLQQQGGNIATLVHQYVQATWCGPLAVGGVPQGNPVPPDPTRGLRRAALQWTGADALGPVKATLCTSGYATQNWYLNGAPFGPRIGEQGAGSEPVAIELAYRAPSGKDYHVFFIEDLLVRVDASERSITGTRLEAMWVGTDLPAHPIWVADPANFIIPPDAVISPAITTRAPLPQDTTRTVGRRKG